MCVCVWCVCVDLSGFLGGGGGAWWCGGVRVRGRGRSFFPSSSAFFSGFLDVNYGRVYE